MFFVFICFSDDKKRWINDNSDDGATKYRNALDNYKKGFREVKNGCASTVSRNTAVVLY